MNNEFKRMQQLAGIKEIKIRPGGLYQMVLDGYVKGILDTQGEFYEDEPEVMEYLHSLRQDSPKVNTVEDAAKKIKEINHTLTELSGGYPGMGDFYDGVYGDLIVRINLNAQDNFDKYENHLVYNAYMDLEQLKSGSILIPHPDGEINVKLPKKIDTSLPLRVKSKGFKFTTVGDLIINQYVKFNRD